MAEPELEIDLRVEHDDWTGLEAAIITALVLAGELERAAGEVSVLLTSDAEIAALNKAWRGKDGPTNVLSFPAPEGPGQGADLSPIFLGDIVMAAETIGREAREQGKSVEAHAAHMVVHGLLHLLGYDHEIESEAVAMESRERSILSKLGIDDPYAERVTADGEKRTV